MIRSTILYIHTVVLSLLATLHVSSLGHVLLLHKNIAELVVGFETTSLEVSESAGKVELCVNISQPSTAPVEIEFNLTVQLHAGTADSSDFVQLTSANQFLNEFGNHKRRQCFNVTIINDSTDENDEMFTVVLAKHSNERHPHIRIHPGRITITITDDDNRRCPPRTSPSQTRQRTFNYHCPDRRTDGYICSSRGIHAPILVMTSPFKFATYS